MSLSTSLHNSAIVIVTIDAAFCRRREELVTEQSCHTTLSFLLKESRSTRLASKEGHSVHQHDDAVWYQDGESRGASSGGGR